MKLEVETARNGRHRWRLVITAADLGSHADGLDRRLRVGGRVRAKLDYAAPSGRTGIPARSASLAPKPAARSRPTPSRRLTTATLTRSESPC